MAGTEKNNLREQVAMLPQSPGVYQFVDRSGTIIYVGKANAFTAENTWSGWISIEMFFMTTQLYLQKAEMQLYGKTTLERAF